MILAEKLKGKDGRQWIKVSFKYNQLLVNMIKTVPGALFSPQQRVWAIPYDHRAEFERIMDNYLINWVDEELPNNGGISESTISPQPVVPGYSVEYDSEGNIIGSTGFKTTPWGEFQVKGFNLLVERNFLILADDAGLGN